MEPRELLYKLKQMLELTKRGKSAIELEDFQTLKSILLEKERLIQEVSFPSGGRSRSAGPAPASVDEIRGVIEQIIQRGEDSEKRLYQKWLADKDELKRVSDARRTLISYAPKQKRAPRMVNMKC